jgi:hypothetical protein
MESTLLTTKPRPMSRVILPQKERSDGNWSDQALSPIISHIQRLRKSKKNQIRESLECIGMRISHELDEFLLPPFLVGAFVRSLAVRTCAAAINYSGPLLLSGQTHPPNCANVDPRIRAKVHSLTRGGIPDQPISLWGIALQIHPALLERPNNCNPVRPDGLPLHLFA